MVLLSTPLFAQSLSMSEAAAKASELTGGKVLHIKPTPKGSDYRVKVLLPEGRVRHIIINGKNGSLKKSARSHRRHQVTPKHPPK